MQTSAKNANRAFSIGDNMRVPLDYYFGKPLAQYRIGFGAKVYHTAVPPAINTAILPDLLTHCIIEDAMEDLRYNPALC